MNGENAAFLLTARGPAAIALIRLVGPKVADFLKCFSKPVIPGKCVHGELRDGDVVIDDPVVVAAGDLSWVDVSVHGGAWVIGSVLELAKRLGFEILDDPPPQIAFPEAADLLEAEMLSHLPLARTELALRTLLAQPAAWKRGAPDIADRSLWHLLHPPRVAIVGEPNVGKSTLANRLFGQERSITADIAGTTRDWVGEIADIDGLAVILVDTPGDRATVDPLEEAAIAASRDQIRQADLVIRLLDATRLPTKILPGEMPVVNKCDLLAAWDIKSSNALKISARSGEGIPELRKQILSHFGIHDYDILRARWWTEQQRRILSVTCL
ncbi:MAG: GTPase [Tepidisphaeraceae bacterium]|jgi:small GTP-binding protein